MMDVMIDWLKQSRVSNCKGIDRLYMFMICFVLFIPISCALKFIHIKNHN